jgi:hypothetical protein
VSTLDRVEARPTGHGRLDLGLLMRGGADQGILAALVDYQHRITKNTSAFAEGTAGIVWDDASRRWQVDTTAGLRMRW